MRDVLTVRVLPATVPPFRISRLGMVTGVLKPSVANGPSTETKPAPLRPGWSASVKVPLAMMILFAALLKLTMPRSSPPPWRAMLPLVRLIDERFRKTA
jgi:hypothetical protein